MLSPSMIDTRFPWRIFWVLLGAALIGYAAALPYIFALFEKMVALKEQPMSTPVFVAVQMMQASILFGMIIGVGLLVSRKVDLRTPILRAWLYGNSPDLPRGAFRVPIIVGLAVGTFTALALYGYFVRQIPGWPSEAMLPIWQRLLACIYGAINEELLLRLFFMSLLLWGLQAISGRTVTEWRPVIFWTANAIVALVFGAAYLPAAKTVIELTPLAIVGIVGLKAVAGLVYGYFCWVRGLEAAMLAHFSADVVLHVIGPMFAPM